MEPNKFTAGSFYPSLGPPPDRIQRSKAGASNPISVTSPIAPPAFSRPEQSRPIAVPAMAPIGPNRRRTSISKQARFNPVSPINTSFTRSCPTGPDRRQPSTAQRAQLEFGPISPGNSSIAPESQRCVAQLAQFGQLSPINEAFAQTSLSGGPPSRRPSVPKQPPQGTPTKQAQGTPITPISPTDTAFFAAAQQAQLEASPISPVNTAFAHASISSDRRASVSQSQQTTPTSADPAAFFASLSQPSSRRTSGDSGSGSGSSGTPDSDAREHTPWVCASPVRDVGLAAYQKKGGRLFGTLGAADVWMGWVQMPDVSFVGERLEKWEPQWRVEKRRGVC